MVERHVSHESDLTEATTKRNTKLLQMHSEAASAVC